ncbi:hypothetical protein DIPPA_19891 [Diplonema papillatum]|nr:hypothetical protein DIPPA_19891 [Diplonema papillatum]
MASSDTIKQTILGSRVPDDIESGLAGFLADMGELEASQSIKVLPSLHSVIIRNIKDGDYTMARLKETFALDREGNTANWEFDARSVMGAGGIF